MSEPAFTPALTYEDYLDLPDDGRRYELVEGDLFVTAAPFVRHQSDSGNLYLLLAPFVRKHRLGQVLYAPTDVKFSATTVVQPDLFFVAAEHRSRILDAYVEGPPDLVVEILSEKSRRYDERTKKQLYEKFGVREYWILDSDLEKVKVYRQGLKGYGAAVELAAENGDQLTSPLFPGLAIEVAEIFV